LGSLFRQWRHLETLICRDNKQLRLACHPDAPRTLRSLDVQGCSIHPSNIQALMTRCERLNSLSLTLGPEFGQLPPVLADRVREFNVDSVGAGSLFTMHEHYVTLAVSNLLNMRSVTICSHLVNDAFFKVLAGTLRNLEELRIPGSRPAYLTSVTFSLLELTALPQLSMIGLRGNPMARTLLLICHRFKYLVEIDASYSIKERDMVDIWHDVRSDTLQKLSLCGFCSPTQDKASATRRTMALLRPNCPELARLTL